VAVVCVGRTALRSGWQDANIYLEAAHNLWFEGRYLSHLSSLYPPGYSGAIAPLMALEDPALLFPAIHLLNVALGAAACLCLLPLLTATLGRSRAWAAAALLLWLPSSWTHHLVPQSENLYGACLLAMVGALYVALRRDRAWTWLACGAALGLALATRRFALVPAIALGLVLPAAELLETIPRPGRLARRAGLLAAGALLGFTPEWAYVVTEGHLVSPYKSGAAGHANLMASAFTAPGRALYMAHTFARQLAYLHLAAAGALAVTLGWFAAGLRHDRERLRADPALTGAALFALLTAAGTVVLTAAHMMSTYTFDEPYHLYSRYLDPCVAPLLVTAACLAVPGRRAVPWLLAGSALCLAAAPMWRFRGPRLAFFAEALKDDHPGLAMIAVVAAAVAAGLLAVLLARRERLAGLAWLGGAVVLGALLCVPMLLNERLQRRLQDVHRHAIFDAPAFQQRPDATMGFLDVPRLTRSRRNAEVLFRTSHPWRFVPEDGADVFFAEHPDGLLLAPRRHRVDGARLHRAGRWTLYGSGDDRGARGGGN